MQTEREELLYRARLAELLERYDDMIGYLKSIIGMGVDLTVEERNMLSVAYKNLVGRNRTSHRFFETMKSDRQLRGAKQEEAMDKYREVLASETRNIANDVLEVLDTKLIKPDSPPESKVFFLKMKGDYERYIAEFSKDEERAAAAAASQEAYEAASQIAAKELPSTHPIRLGLALNFSVFYYEIRDSPDKACQLAKSAFDSAISELDNLSEESYKDSTLIMQLLRDNLTLWTADAEGEEEAKKSPEQKA